MKEIAYRDGDFIVLRATWSQYCYLRTELLLARMQGTLSSVIAHGLDGEDKKADRLTREIYEAAIREALYED